jgi:LruC domain-containing protein
MKTSNATSLSILFVAVSLFLLSSCAKSDSSSGTDISTMKVPDDFDWSTIKSVQLTVVPENISQYYCTFAVYGENPLFNSSAPLLAKGVSKGGQSYVTNLVLPTSTTEIYVRQIDASENEILQSVSVSGDDLTCDFSSVSSSAQTAKKSIPLLRSAKVATADPTPTATGTVVLSSTSGDIGWDNNKNYVIPSGVTYSGTIALGTNSNLYIDGIYLLNNKKKTFSMASGKLVIQSDGKMQVSSDVDLSFYAGQINNYGTLTADGKFALTSKATMYNIGTMAFAKFTSSNAENTIVNDGSINAVNMSVQSKLFTNNGTLDVTGVFEVTSTSSFENNGSAVAAELDTKSGSIIYNNCHINVGTLLDLHGTTYYGYDGSLLEAVSLVADGTTFTMSEASILDADVAAFSTWRNYINGAGSDYALARFGKVEAYNNAISKNITYQGKLEIECSDHPENDKYNPFWVVEGSNVRWSAAGASTTVIASTGCNDGGNAVAVDPVTPTDPTFPILVNLTTNYSFIMEDNWPWKGDYDLNDIVVDLSISYLQNSDNKATEMNVAYKLRAVGASKRIAAAFQLDKILPSQISGVSYKTSVLTGTVFATEKGGLETGQSKAVVPLFDDAHLLLNPSTGATTSLINTIIGGEYYELVNDTIKIVFTDTVDPSTISITNLNFFIVTDATSSSAKRTEVHLSGYDATDKVDATLLGTGSDYIENGASYRTVDNMVWGLIIPITFQYASESRDITLAYPQFTQWCLSGGVDNTYWYEYPTDVSGYIFTKK